MRRSSMENSRVVWGQRTNKAIFLVTTRLALACNVSGEPVYMAPVWAMRSIMTAEPHAHWLEHLGYTRFSQNGRRHENQRTAVNPLQRGTDHDPRTDPDVTRNWRFLNHAVFRGAKAPFFRAWIRGF